MNQPTGRKIMRAGANAVLQESIRLLSQRFSGKIANGANCSECGMSGIGTPVDHGRGCHGVKALAGLQDLQSLINKGKRI